MGDFAGDPRYGRFTQEELNARAAQAALRKCLACGKQFLSKWCGNRICQKCSAIINRGSRIRTEEDYD